MLRDRRDKASPKEKCSKGNRCAAERSKKRSVRICHCSKLRRCCGCRYLKKSDEASSDKYIDSPLVGIFYTAPGEGEAPFVSVGDRVKKGQTLGIVEAMKLMHEITCEQNGIVKEICAQNGDAVEYGQKLFIIEEA